MNGKEYHENCTDADERALSLIGASASPLRLLVLRALMQGPRGLKEIREELVRPKTPLWTGFQNLVLEQMVSTGLLSVEKGGGQAVYSITDRGRVILKAIGRLSAELERIRKREETQGHHPTKGGGWVQD